MSTIGPQGIQAFITKWEVSGAAERANAQLFIAELCDVIGVEPPRPKTPDEHINAYVYEKTIPSVTDSTNFIDCYKRGHFVLETKQGADGVRADRDRPSAEGDSASSAEDRPRHTRHQGWDAAMLKAHAQAQRYGAPCRRKRVPDGRPPFSWWWTWATASSSSASSRAAVANTWPFPIRPPRAST
ncbi:MAG: hypothetical protein IPO56_08725 [Flavobacteriales bacterium]|nr:hypothetical protein [Flavobacteriales bacterium]